MNISKQNHTENHKKINIKNNYIIGTVTFVLLILIVFSITLYFLLPVYKHNTIITIITLNILGIITVTLSVINNSKHFIKPLEEINDSLQQLLKGELIKIPINNKLITKNLLENFNNSIDMILQKDIKLRESNKLLTEYIKAIDKSAIITKINLNKEITYINTKFQEISGYTQEELLGQKYYNHIDVSDIQDKNKLIEKFRSSLLDKKIEEGELKMKKKKLGYYRIKFYRFPVIDDNGKIIESIAIGIDITDIKNAQETLKNSIDRLKELDEKKTEFVNLASHELRTPMTTIRGYASMILDGDAGQINEEVKLYVKNIYQDSSRLIELINNMLDISKIEAGKEDFNFQEINGYNFLDEIYSNAISLAKKKEIQIIKKHSNNLEKIKLEVNKTKQILINLIGNAIKFTPAKGTVEIVMNLIGNILTLIIKDNGIGIDKKDFNIIFEKFGQADSSRFKGVSGTGLGLPIVKTLVEKLNGQILLESELNKGSIFIVKLPIYSNNSL